MRKIAVLDQNTIDKIAAGEVVERPASVVKELVENAIDAGATAVTVEIKNGGISLIRVTDNGRGIAKEQVPLAFLRHATSKIEKVEDLLQISSLGFRGEALSSISAVSQVELITKVSDELMGVRYQIEGGKEKGLEEVGAPQGTTILIHNLFYNTPARAKFLKAPQTEASYVGTYMEQLALSHPDISFKFMVNGQTKLHSSGNNRVKDVIYGIYGRDITRELVEVDWEKSGIRITGYIGKPVICRGNRNFENYYINGRYVKSRIIMKAVEDAYKPFMMQHKYPFVCLSYEVDGNEVDVNVHPTKMEVRFQKQMEIYNATYEAVHQGLTHKELIPEVQFDRDILEKKVKEKAEKEKIQQQRAAAPEPFERKRIEIAQADRIGETKASYSPGPVMVETPKPAPEIVQEVKPEIRQEVKTEMPKMQEKPQQMELFDDKLLSKEARIRHRIIGQLFETYWLVEYDEKFYIIDQHAAHEKVLYERFVKEYENREVLSQMISPPQIVTLNLQESILLNEHMEIFERFGFEISSFGGKEYSISAVPSNLFGIEVQDLFVEILDKLESENPKKLLDSITAKIATAACKAAVKGNQMLSLAEADKLIDELLTLENPYHCPHGRPTIVSMTKYELEKKFKRIV